MRPDLILQVDEILLRPWTTDDARWYVESRDEEVFRLTTERRDLTIPEAIDGIRQANKAKDIFCFAIAHKDGGQLLGNIALALEKDNLRSGELMFWLTPSARGRGVAVRAARLLCQWAFAELILDRITAKTLPDNHRSQRVLEKLGFRSDLTRTGQDHDKTDLWFVLARQPEHDDT